MQFRKPVSTCATIIVAVENPISASFLNSYQEEADLFLAYVAAAFAPLVAIL
jgi:hypothetical protein